MLVLTIQTEMPLVEPNEEFGFVTWLDVSIRQFDAASREPIGHARIAVVQVADAMNRGVEIREVLDADSEELFGLYEVFFDDEEYLKPGYANGIGFNVMYFAEIELVPAWRGKRIEEALVRRVSDTWGEGCAVAVVAVEDNAERWREVGFQTAEPTSRYVFLDLSLRHPELVADDEQGHGFRVEASS